MRNGIKKLLITSLFVIFGLCFNSSFAYTQIENCYDTNKLCRDYGVNESYNTNGATISYGAYLNTPGYSKSFMVQYNYTNSSSITFKIRQYLIYNENGYYSIIQAFQRETDPQKTSIYLYTGSSGYCIPEENNNRCGNATNSFRPYNKSIELVNSGINGSIMTGYRIMFYDSTPNLVHVICPMFENGFMFCMPFRQQTNNGSISNSTNYGLTRQVISEDTIPPFNDRDYITSNITIGNTPFTMKEPQTTPEINYACPTIQQLINTYPSQYNTGLCYSSSLIFSGGTIQQVEPQDIFTLYPLYTGFVADINLYNNYCVGPNTQTACETAFQGKTEQYTLISKIPDNVKKANLYAYCNLQLNYEDKNASTCVTSGAINTGEYIPPITNQGVIDELIDGDYNIILPASGYVMDTLKDENGERKINWNIIESIQNLYSKFTTIFTGREGNNGIIPEYITRMILVIILFAFFKK